MVIHALLLDRSPAYLRDEAGMRSLLLAPLGTRTLLEHIRAQLRPADPQGIAIVPGAHAHGAYEEAIRAVAPDARILHPLQLERFLDQHELADRLLIIEAVYFPLGGYDFDRLLADAAHDGTTGHVLHHDVTRATTEEQVLYDEQGRVRSVQRLYQGVTQVERLMECCSLVSIAAMRCLRRATLVGLADLRMQLASAGVPSRDISSPRPAISLAREAGLLACNEWLLARLQAAGRTNGAQRLIDAAATIDPTARLYGRVVAQAGVRVDAGAVIVGPAVLGVGAHIQTDATLVQSVVWPHTVVAPGEPLLRRVVTDRTERTAAPARAPLLSLALAAEHSSANGKVPAPARGWYRAAKRVLDFSVALVSLLVLSPLFAAVALLLKLTSRGPVFFGHDREGRGGQVFRCWKFRTMVDRAHTMQRQLYNQSHVDGPQFKIDKDPRVTLLGKWLRASNIDELPQLFNVLRGDMSLVGPRPSPFRENQICVPWRNARLSVRPGITGLWQVCRHERAAGDFHQWIYFDMLYVRHLSFALDLKILLATVLTASGKWPVKVGWLIPAQRLRPLQRTVPVAPAAVEVPAESSAVTALN